MDPHRHAFSAIRGASVIATGGLVPAGATSILRKESGEIHRDAAGNTLLRFNDTAKHGEPALRSHIRPAGEEAATGEVLIPAGTELNPGHIALAAVAGHDLLQVRGKPLVGIVLTGSEVVASGVPEPGHVRDAFGPQLGSVISLLGGTPAGSLRVGDSYDEWLTVLGGSEAFPGPTPDVTITTGGTGCSGTDHFRNAIAALGGQLLLDGIAMRPGHPAVLAGLPDGRFVIGLPGNPLAAMMALITIGTPLLDALGGRPLAAVGQVTSAADVDPCPGRTRLIPCRFIEGLAFPVSHAGPGMLRGLAAADGVMAVPLVESCPANRFLCSPSPGQSPTTRSCPPPTGYGAPRGTHDSAPEDPSLPSRRIRHRVPGTVQGRRTRR
ncbi:molybdopterin-binding protein [Arthrobacter sp. SA17]